MKIAIAELETPAEIIDLDRATATDIVGGATFGATSIELGATGDNASTDLLTFSVTFDVLPEFAGVGSVTITGGLGVASDSFPVSLGLTS